MDHLAPDGPVYQAGTLSGNPLAMAAGLAQLRELERSDAWQRLEELGAQLENGVRVEAAAAGCTIQRAGSMFSLFFTEGPVRNLEEATKSDTAKFGNFFHYCLDHGVYFPPSQFETGFISTAHTGEDIARTVGVVAQALRHAA
jgi:glutamate-1-semialdehyde 2,1-aminomutase